MPGNICNRTEKEIDNMIERIAKLWKKFPELRLGQLIQNCLFDGDDLYYMPDKELLDKIESFYANK